MFALLMSINTICVAIHSCVIFYSNFCISLLAYIIIYFIYTENIHEKFKRKIRSQMSATYVAYKCAKCFVFSHVNEEFIFKIS